MGSWPHQSTCETIVPYSTRARALPPLLPNRSTWDRTKRAECSQEPLLHPAHHPHPGATSNPHPERSSPSSGDRSPGHLLQEDLEPPHGEFQTRAHGSGSSKCGLLRPPCMLSSSSPFRAQLGPPPPGSPPYASSSYWPLPFLTPLPCSAGQGGGRRSLSLGGRRRRFGPALCNFGQITRLLWDSIFSM